MKLSCLVLILLILILCESTSSTGDAGALTVVDNDEDSTVENEDDGDEVSIHTDTTSNTEPFIPTKEWQEVKPGQSVPAGLNIRLNLQTGKKEARLMEEIDSSVKHPAQDEAEIKHAGESSRLQRVKLAIEEAVKDYNLEQSSKSEPLTFWTDGKKQGVANTKKDSFTKEELKLALKKFKATQSTIEQENAIKDKFRSADELLKDMKKMETSVKMDSEIIRELLNQYQEESLPIEQKINILTDLEFYVHQIDNALDFMKMGGITMLVKAMNHTDKALKSEAVFVLGSAVQSNPSVQKVAMESGALHQLIRMLSGPAEEKSQSRAMYAVSALLRHFPTAQNKFVDLGGIQTLTDILSHGSQKMKVKAVTLINDLITEKGAPFAEDLKNENTLHHFEENLKEQGACHLISDLLSLPEHDARHKVIMAMQTLLPTCQEQFLRAVPSLQSLREHYRLEADMEGAEGDEDYFFRDLFNSVIRVLDDLGAYRRSTDL